MNIEIPGTSVALGGPMSWSMLRKCVVAGLPAVHFVVDEGRSWLARTDKTFDVVQMSLVDTWAATGAGAFTLSENGLYTVDAWKIFVSRLRPTGVVVFEPADLACAGRAMCGTLGMVDKPARLDLPRAARVLPAAHGAGRRLANDDS